MKKLYFAIFLVGPYLSYADTNNQIPKPITNTVSIAGFSEGIYHNISSLKNDFNTVQETVKTYKETKEIARYNLYWAKKSGNISDIKSVKKIITDLDEKYIVADQYSKYIKSDIEFFSKPSIKKVFNKGIDKLTKTRNIGDLKTSFQNASKVGKGLMVAGTGIGLYNTYQDYENDLQKYSDSPKTAFGFATVQATGEVLNNLNPLAIVGIADTLTDDEYTKAWISAASNPIGSLVNTSRKLADSFIVSADMLESEVYNNQELYSIIDNYIKKEAFAIPKKNITKLLTSSNIKQFEYNAKIAARKLEANIEHFIELIKSYIQKNNRDIDNLKLEIKNSRFWNVQNNSLFNEFKKNEIKIKEGHYDILNMKLKQLEKFKNSIIDSNGEINPKIMFQYSNSWTVYKALRTQLDYQKSVSQFEENKINISNSILSQINNQKPNFSWKKTTNNLDSLNCSGQVILYKI